MNVIQYTLDGPQKNWWILQHRERRTLGAKVCDSPPGSEPRCLIRVSHKKSLITFSTSYKTNIRHSNGVASSLNRGFRAPEKTSLQWSGSYPPSISQRGRERFRTLPTHLDTLPVLFMSFAWGVSLMRSREIPIGSSHFRTLCDWR